MSFWDGSEWERQQEDRAMELRYLEGKVRRDNPSLSADDVRTVALQEYARLHPAPLPKCCACQSAARAEIVRVGPNLGQCACKCHSGWGDTPGTRR